MSADRSGVLLEGDVDADPLRQLERWFEDARAAGIDLPEAATLATSSLEGAPSARMVLLKDFGERGLLFHTGYGSRKSRELEENPRAAVVFYWHALGRQVRVEGTVERVSEEESDAYFRTRPLESRLAAWASAQSEVIASREELDRKFEEARERFADGDVPLPPHWGGFRVVPEVFEFWQHRESRLHDRIRYRRDADDGWVVERLAP